MASKVTQTSDAKKRLPLKKQLIVVTFVFALLISLAIVPLMGLAQIPPVTTSDYSDYWHTSSPLIITLTYSGDFAALDTYYKINGGPTQTVNANGQPQITTESATNTLEYWSIDDHSNTESPHNTLTGIKLDTVAPTGSISIDNGNATTSSTSVTLTLTYSDATSGVYQVRYGNGGYPWGTDWVSPSTSYAWTLSLGDEVKTVNYQIRDAALLESVVYSDTIELVGSGTTATPAPTPTAPPSGGGDSGSSSSSSSSTTTTTPTPAPSTEPTPAPSEEPTSTISPTPTPQSTQGGLNFLLIGGIAVAALAAVGGASVFYVMKNKKVNEKSLRNYSSSSFQDWVIKKFDGRPSDPGSGVDGYTAGGQPILIKQSDNVSLSEVEGFVNTLARGKAQKGIIVAFNFAPDAIEGKLMAEDKGIDLQMVSSYELYDKRFADKIKGIASSQATFDAGIAAATAPAYMLEEGAVGAQLAVLKPTIFISHSITDMTDQLKQFLEFLHYDCVMGDKEETPVPIPDAKFDLMSRCDCAIITVSAIEQERRYGGVYLLNPNIVAEISASYIKYNKQIILVAEGKVELPLNLRGLKRIEYNNGILSSTSAIEMAKMLTEFKKV